MHTAEEFKKGEKRARLTEAAELFSINKAYITQHWLISPEAEVPLGNIYYHFRTKEIADRSRH